MSKNNLYQDTDNSCSQYSDEEMYNLAEKYDDLCEKEKALSMIQARLYIGTKMRLSMDGTRAM